jgi:hypothetical protein
VQKAMLTPSAVLAYWMRGSMAGLFYTVGTFETGLDGSAWSHHTMFP